MRKDHVSDAADQSHESTKSVAAGMLAPWQVGELPEPPRGGWRLWVGLLGPGVLLAGASIGTGEWLFGPAVSAQYGATLLWLATLSILGQLFCNLVMMRYTLYCGEPILVGGFRTWPGPKAWTAWYAMLEFGNSIFPYNAANAAVPLAAAILGHLPGNEQTSLFGIALSEIALVKLLGFTIFLVAFVPLIFGGTVYRMLERLMVIKIVIVLSYLAVVCGFMVSGRTARSVATGFLRVGTVPLRAETVVAGRHFTVSERANGVTYSLKGTIERRGMLVTEFAVQQSGEVTKYKMGRTPPDELLDRRDRLIRRAETLTDRGGFFVEYTFLRAEQPVTISIEGEIARDQAWHARSISIIDEQPARHFQHIDDVPEPEQALARSLAANQGVVPVNVIRYVREHGKLPDLDWAMLAAFAAIAGAGGLTNTLFSNYARDKGWGMGARVGAIPSAVGGRRITLSHVGCVFPLNDESRARWRGWLRHILRDQVAIWMVCCFVGMALPCMLSIEFIRNAPVEDNRVAAMAAEGMATRYPDHAKLFLYATLACGFLIIAPGQIVAGDTVARRWTDILWTSSTRVHRLGGNQVKYVYYAILMLYGVCGLITLALFKPLQIAKIGAVLQNVGLGFTALHALHVNRTLLPRELRPNWFMQAGVVCCGVFFLGISVIVLLTL